ncbi:hypothetical protein BC832DRAFT_169986 [Gaertneriomyces semiglobifer]|nr:hypothetical protein BC832DRAFT_169986 [Gaertneriomyces semiglobifer]
MLVTALVPVRRTVPIEVAYNQGQSLFNCAPCAAPPVWFRSRMAGVICNRSQVPRGDRGPGRPTAIHIVSSTTPPDCERKEVIADFSATHISVDTILVTLDARQEPSVLDKWGPSCRFRSSFEN